jgi:hypothetical protein
LDKGPFAQRLPILFGEKMRTTFLEKDFGPQGKAVLLILGSLLCAGWLLAGLS